MKSYTNDPKSQTKRQKDYAGLADLEAQLPSALSKVGLSPVKGARLHREGGVMLVVAKDAKGAEAFYVTMLGASFRASHGVPTDLAVCRLVPVPAVPSAPAKG
jgi:hypothetical protein